MKTEKKSNEPSCVAPIVAKEESESADNRVKIKEESGQGTIEEGAPGEDNTDCLKETALEVPSAETTLGGSADTQNGSGNQGILNSVKVESDTISNTVEELPPDCGTNVGLPGDALQPLSSNVLSKQMGSSSNTGEAQYMQQQSQIFVFSTVMANKGAEMVINGQFSTIIAFHMAQPGTKKFLEKHPNKMPHFRPNPAQWLSNFAGMKQKGHQHSPNMGFPGEQLTDLPHLDPSDSAFWSDQPNMRNLNGSNPMGNPESSMDDSNLNVPCLVPNSPSNPVNPQSVGGSTIGHSPNLMGDTTSPGPGGVQPSLQGKKVPNENMTPQQLQHREEKLALLSKMRQQFLMADHTELPAGQMDPTQGNLQGSHCPTSLPPVSNPNQCSPAGMDWQKLQHPFMDGKNKVGVGSPNMSVRQCGTTPGGMITNTGGSGSVGPAPGPLGGANPSVPPVGGGRTGTQGPPPPYHQTTRSASVPIAIQSPNPSSPSNQTSNLSLPSPRASSALNSPADCNRQFQLTNPNAPGGGPTGQRSAGHLPGQSPTSQDSPNPGAVGTTGTNASRLNCSNPGTPVSHGHLAALSPSGTPQKDPSTLDFPTNQTSNVDNMFCRTMQSMQQKQQLGPPGGPKELMPVPSPQQLPYLNSFDGQELTIQKQPNTSIKEPGNTQANNPEMGNRMLSGNLEAGNNTVGNNQFGQRSEVSSPSIDNSNRGFGGSLHSPHTPHTPHTPGSAAPHTPVDTGKSGNKTQSAQSSPASHNTSLTEMGMGPPRIPASPNTKSETSPSSKDLQQQQQQPNLSGVVPGQGNNQGNVPGNMMSMVNAGGNAPFGCGRPTTNVSQPNENIPLNPNNIGNRMGGLGPMSSNSFDPISSLAQMSQQLTNTAASNVLGNDNSPMHVGNAPGMMPFNHQNMHMMQMQQQQQQQQGLNEMNGNCHMGAGVSGPTSEPGNVSSLCMGLGGPATSYSPTPHTGSPGLPNKMGHPMMSHGIMTAGGPQGPVNPNVNVSQSGAYPSGPGPGMMGPEGPQNRLGMPGQLSHQAPPHHQHVHGPGSYNGTNVQVKPSAPNTIQYLPARPTNVGHAPRGPPSLDFLQRFTNPMSGMDTNKMNSPSVNLQYFPNGCVPNNLGPGPGSGPSGPQGPPHGNMSGPGPGPGNMPPNMGGNVQPGMGVQPQGHMHPSMRPVGGVPGSQGPGMRQQSNIIRMQHMAGGGMFPSSPIDPDKVFSPDMGPGPQMPGQTGSPGMYGVPPLGPGQKQTNPMGQLGPPPDATQPLPPSMGAGGTGTNFKNSPFMSGPTMSDPNYAQQYHHFQQQLYATGTRGNNGPPAHPGMHNQPNSHQQFFMPK